MEAVEGDLNISIDPTTHLNDYTHGKGLSDKEYEGQ